MEQYHVKYTVNSNTYNIFLNHTQIGFVYSGYHIAFLRLELNKKIKEIRCLVVFEFFSLLESQSQAYY